MPLLSGYTFIATKFNENFGAPFFWLEQRIHEVLEKRLKEKVK
jgi:hypothetical protein